jgi:uncharacterized OB-fold protein
VTPRGEERLFFEAAAEERLVYQTCDTCESTVFYPRAICPHCGGDSLRLWDSDGLGTVYSYTVQHRTRDPRFEAPMTLALVDLDEGFRLLATVIGAVEVGTPVMVEFADGLPRFRPMLEEST